MTAPLNPPEHTTALELLAEHSGDVIVRLSPEGHIRWCSPSATRFALDPDELTGTHALELVHRDDVPGLLSRLVAPIRNGASSTVLFRLVPQSGEERWVEASVHPVPDQAEGLWEVQAVVRDVADRHAESERLRRAALHDPLTDLPNRTLLVDRLDHALVRARRDASRVGLLFCDLDRFKLVNDTHGHNVGDELIVATAERLLRSVRASDTVARLGGDEFVVICPDLNPAAAERDVAAVAETVRAAMTEPFLSSAGELWVTTSVGYALAQGDETALDLLDDSDVAMYQAKQLGRDRCERFDRSWRHDSSQRLDIANVLHHALTAGKFRLVHQPLVDAASSCPVGIEALLRLDDDRYGHLDPDELLAPVAESELIERIGDWVLLQALEDVGPWLRDSALRCHVNLAARQLFDPAFPARVLELLEAADVSPTALCLEIPEGEYLAVVDRVTPVIAELRDAGVAIAIDDFGTGPASLTGLRHLAADVLKIDGTLVADATTSAHGAALLSAVGQLAKVLSLTTVAEQVETTRAVGAAAALGAEVLQGFAVARPLPPAELSVWLAEHLA
jgi:diguanylate cyclase (GGDEF)-like protein/PAS domain S-box-containing protein